ncbi:MAG: hypothetical protein EBX52_12440 [Proteobacteria bacterium]|nr:hypothetical protein [Pseudomonadota bacterium]
MKLFKPVIFVVTAAVLAACGSSQTPVMSMGYQQGGYTSPWGTNTWNSNGGYTQQVTGGTKTIIPVAGGTMSAGSNKSIVAGFQVQAGDQINVNASGGYAYGVSGTFISYGNSLYLSSINVNVNGSLVGSGLYANYTAPQSGTMQVTFDATGGWSSNYATYQVYLPYQAITIGRCRDTNNQPMACPY